MSAQDESWMAPHAPKGNSSAMEIFGLQKGSGPIVGTPDGRLDRAGRTHILSGWKEIAHFLGKGVRTVQRYENELALPVRRPAGKDRGSVIATKEELAAWVNASSLRDRSDLRPSPGRTSASLQLFKKALAENRNIREQMRSLTTEMRRSRELLRNTVKAIQSETFPSSQKLPVAS